MRQHWLAVVMVGLCLAGSAPAVMLQQGTQEIAVQGTLDFEDVGGTSLNLGFGYGYFIEDYSEVGLRGAMLLSDRVDTYRLGGFGEYHFDIGMISVPYMGGGLGIVTSDIKGGDNKTALFVNGVAGVKIYLVENVALALQANLELATDDLYPADNDVKKWNMTLDLGLRFYF